MRRHLAPVLVVIGTAILMLAPARAQQNGRGQDQSKFHRQDGALRGQYIVILDEDAPGAAGDFGTAAARADEIIARTTTGRVTRVYANAVRGFAAMMSEEDAIALSADPDVRSVEEDSTVEAWTTQSNPPWGLDRIDQVSRPLSLTYSYTTTGSGVHVYVIDTGIRVTHTQFGGRASVAFDAINDGRNGIDCNGHGTHVSGTVGGSTYGVAKAVTLHAVRVLNCSGSGTVSGVVAGVDWVTGHHVNPAVANMSLGGGASSSLDTAVRNSIASGVTYAVAAGNSNYNAAYYSPARVGEAITVGATTSSDQRAYYSNYGSVVDIFAPGSSIVSAWYSSDTATATLSGTSMATPHVAGVAARYLQSNAFATPADVRNAIVAAATLGKITGLPSGTANRLLFWSPSK